MIHRSRRFEFLWVVTALLAVGGVAAAVAHFMTPPYNPGFAEHPVITRLHIVLGAAYLSVAPFQFVRAIRAKHPRYHRWAGRILVIVGCVVGLTALFLGIVIPYSGHPERVVIAGFGCYYLFALVAGVTRIRAGRVARHREWMLRAFAVGLLYRHHAVDLRASSDPH